MEIKFDVYFKKNLGTLCKDNEVDLDGKEAYINLDLSLVDRLEVNYSVGGTKYTDEVTIKDIDNKEILIPFKSDVVKKGLNEFEIVAYIKNGDIKVSQTYTYNIEEGIGEGKQSGSGGSSDGHTHNNLAILNSITQTKISEWNNKADATHIHSEYANITHTHSEYLKELPTHEHSEYLTELPSHEHEQYLTEHQDISHKADKSDIYTKIQTDNKISEEITKAQLGGSGEVDLSAYATVNYVNNKYLELDSKVNSLNDDIEEIRNSGGTGLNEQQVDNRIDLKLSTQYKVNPLEPLDIKTYDGSNQPTHPSVKYFENGFGGHKYWMAYTPYPNNNDALENPCITYSDDGINWSEDGINNPIVSKPSSGYNSDCHLVLVNGLLECWWREVSNNTETIKRKKSENGVVWGKTETLHTTGVQGLLNCVSPSVIYDEGKYKIWVVYNRECLKYYESSDGTNWQYVRDIDVRTNDDVYKVWHIDVIKNNGLYEFVGCYQYQGQFNVNNFIYYSKSKDNITYDAPIKILSNGYEGQFDDMELYRPCLCIDDKSYKLYYGAQKDIRIWHIGLVTCKNIESLGNLLVGQNATIERMQNDINQLYKLLESSNGGGSVINPVVSIKLSEENKDLEIGKTLQLVATVLPDDATNKTVTWSSSDTSKATVSNSGLVVAKNEGEVVISCISNSNNNAIATCNINIIKPGEDLSSLVFNLSAENYSGGLVWEDTQGGSEAVITGDVVKEGTEVKFTGSERFESNITSLNLSDFTLEWYGTLNGGNGEGCLYLGTEPSWGNAIALWRNSNNIGVDAGSGSGISNIPCSLGKHKIIYRYNSETNLFDIFVDTLSSKKSVTNERYGIDKLVLSNKVRTSQGGHIGGIEYIKIYNKCLDDTEIKTLLSK